MLHDTVFLKRCSKNALKRTTRKFRLIFYIHLLRICRQRLVIFCDNRLQVLNELLASLIDWLCKGRHPHINDLQERGKYTFFVNDLSKVKNYPERRRDFRKPVSVTTINNYIRNLRVFFNWLERDYVIKKNPMRKIRQLKNNRKAKVFLTDEDLKKLLSKFDKSYFTEHRDYVMTILMLDSGMRLGECSTLLVTDLELARKRINLRAEETKGRKDRTVYFSPKTEMALRRWLQFKDRYVESEYLFPVKDHGGHINVHNFETNFKRYINRIGLNEEYCPHCLRNNFAKRCLMNGMDLFTLSKILGHSSVEVTEQAYLDLTDDDICRQYHKASPLSNF